MEEGTPLVRLRGVGVRYGETGPEVLRGVDLDVTAGEAVAVVGPSGCGKSTLLNTIGTLQRPTAGEVEFEGLDVGGLDGDELAALRNDSIGFVFQEHHLLPQCTALENAVVPALVSRGPAEREAAVLRARGLLERVGLGARLEHRPDALSGGERQRVALVRALVNQPRLVLADEPTGSLDEQGADAMGDLLVELEREQGVALVVVTHSERLAARMGRALALVDGALAERPATA